MSVMVTDEGLVSVVVKSTFGEKPGWVAPMAVVLSNTETVVALELATARSGLLSPLRSPMASASGAGPVMKSNPAEKLAVAARSSVVLRKTETLDEDTFATAI